MPRLEIRPATAEDFRAVYSRAPHRTMRALVALLDGEPVGFGGYFLEDGVAVAFSDMHGALAGRKKDIIRCARQLMAFIRSAQLPTVAHAQAGTRGIVLKHYGFEPWGKPADEWYALVR
jgi:hypothetical protein